MDLKRSKESKPKRMVLQFQQEVAETAISEKDTSRNIFLKKTTVMKKLREVNTACTEALWIVLQRRQEDHRTSRKTKK